jgi:hypothetical protein
VITRASIANRATGAWYHARQDADDRILNGKRKTENEERRNANHGQQPASFLRSQFSVLASTIYRPPRYLARKASIRSNV